MYKWQFSIAMLVYQRVDRKFQPDFYVPFFGENSKGCHFGAS
jgi:hypothetical protein